MDQCRRAARNLGAERLKGFAVTEKSLLAAANAARGRAYAPYSRFCVGAALLGEDGAIYAGANVENAAYPQSQCAEASAIGVMVAAGCRGIKAVLVVAETADGAPIAPCGACRQRLAEFAAPGVKVHMAAPDGVLATASLDELLPFRFGRGQFKPV